MSLSGPQFGLWRRAFSIDTHTHGFFPLLGSSAATTYPVANQAYYVPVAVRQRVVVRKLWVAVGSTATGNLDVGVYDAVGVRIVSAGSTAKTSDTEQVVDVTDTTIGPGLYYMALNCSNNTDTFFMDSNSSAPTLGGIGVLSEAVGSVTLPATATWAVDQTVTKYPLMGMFLGTVVS